MCPQVEPEPVERSIQRLYRRFAALDDPRVERTKLHDLLDMITIAICAVICGADDWVQIEQFGNEKREFFDTFLQLPNGIPSHDTFGRVFARINPEQFQACFLEWVQELVCASGGLLKGVIAIDGKTLCGSRDTPSGKGAIQMVSAWALENRMVLGQVKVDDKSNEITAIPALLKLFDLSGCIVTIDAMGTQWAIAQAITDAGADYVLSLKGNQGNMHRDVTTMFDEAHECEFKGISHQATQQVEKGHGRIETRSYYLIDDPQYLQYLNPKGTWSNLRGVGMVQSEREVRWVGGVGTGSEKEKEKQNEKEKEGVSKESRYYLCSVSSVEEFAGAARGHWGIENGLHWVLDVAFREDKNRTRKDHSAHNFGILRHISVNLLKGEKSAKVGIKTKRLKAGWNHNYLLKVLLASQPI
jgi:predicted transposase YbfD/YdcC